MVKQKKDTELRDFSEVFSITLRRAAERIRNGGVAGARGSEKSYSLGTESVELRRSGGRVLAVDIESDRDLPPYNRVAVDGYACRRADLPGPIEVIGTTSAGDPAEYRVSEGTCVQVMTGGMLPKGADLVVMVEQSETVDPDAGADPSHTEGSPSSSEKNYIRCTASDPSKLPSNYSPRGEDVPKGQVVLQQGTILAPRHTALLASVGHAAVEVYCLPRVGLLSTGDEVVEPERTPEAHQIRNANAPQTAAQLRELGIEPTYYGIVPDDPQALVETLGRARRENDLVLMSGGVSMGEFDFGPEAIEKNGFAIQYDRVAIKPGRPTTFAVSDRADLFGLPGNPVSCFVIFELLVKPYLYRLMNTDYRPHRAFGVMASRFERKRTSREEWIPVTVDEQAQIRPLEYHGSAHFQSLSLADGMIRIERGKERLEKGETLAVRLV